MAQPHRVLRRCDKLKTFGVRQVQQPCQFIGVIEMVIGKWAGVHHRAPGSCDRIEELSGMTDAGEGKEAALGEAFRILWLQGGIENRFSSPRGLPHHAIGGAIIAHSQQGIGIDKLIYNLCPQRSGGNDLAISQSMAGIDHQQRIIDVNAGALETVIHDKEIAALLIQQKPGAGGAVCGYRNWGMSGQKQRFIANMFCRIMVWIDNMRG